jgi:hypothetical protein
MPESYLGPIRLTADLWAMPVQERLVKLNWLGNMWRSDSGTPFLAPDFIGRRAQRGAGRRARGGGADGAGGPHPGGRLGADGRGSPISDRYPPGTPVIVLSRNGGAGPPRPPGCSSAPA